MAAIAELAAKRLQLLHELVPAANIIALLVNPTDSNVETTLKSLRAAARDLGLQLHVLRASTAQEVPIESRRSRDWP
jgi:ABC-type uncharacterized transport system substrate-binding protein